MVGAARYGEPPPTGLTHNAGDSSCNGDFSVQITELRESAGVDSGFEHCEGREARIVVVGAARYGEPPPTGLTNNAGDSSSNADFSVQITEWREL